MISGCCILDAGFSILDSNSGLRKLSQDMDFSSWEIHVGINIRSGGNSVTAILLVSMEKRNLPVVGEVGQWDVRCLRWVVCRWPIGSWAGEGHEMEEKR